jgi:3-oxoacyl-[acyl-carrier-protein] synthase II
MNREIVVTGVGAVTPLGVGARTLYERWRAGVSGIQDGAGAATEFEPTDYLTVKEVRRSDRFSQFAMVASDEALAEAGWKEDGIPYDVDRVATLIGTGIGGIGTLEACAAGAHAIGTAARMIQTGDAEAVVTGGSEAALTPLATAAFAALDALSEKGVSRPFDANRDGFVMGEGAAVLVLEDGDRARARGANILARLAGYGASSDSYHLTAPEKDGGGAIEAMTQALRDAGYSPQDVVYVNAHGTSTPLNDRAETIAIKKVLGDGVPVSSLKSAIGHLLGAAGAVEAVATILAMRDRVAPPTLNYETPDEGLDLDYVPNEARTLDINGKPAVALSNAFGFGGHNAVLCLEVA